MKAAKRWRAGFGSPLKDLLHDGVVASGFGVYTGATELKDGPLTVLPLKRFLGKLAAGDFF